MEDIILNTAYLIVKLNDSNRLLMANEKEYKKQIAELLEELEKNKNKK